MRTEQEIKTEIELTEIEIAKLLDKQKRTGNIFHLGYIEDYITVHRRKIKQLEWVLKV